MTTKKSNILAGSQAPALIVIHKYLKARHPGRDCRDPEAMDGNTETNSMYHHRELLNKITRSHPCALGSGNPCRNDGLPQTLVYNNESSGLGMLSWEATAYYL
ncbi:MAG: hypothetical protein Q8L15_10380 [Methylobacter sp.]|nr:hypothetical protein [Methylobacter sp.]